MGRSTSRTVVHDPDRHRLLVIALPPRVVDHRAVPTEPQRVFVRADGRLLVVLASSPDATPGRGRHGIATL
jgi:hypothetical protein